MADQKLTELDAFTPVLTDVIYGADDPGGTPVSGKITLSALNTLFGANIQVAATSQVTGLDAALAAKATLTGTETLTNKTLTQPTLTLKQGSSAAPTAEGVVEWDLDSDRLAVGDGTTTAYFIPSVSFSGDATVSTTGVVTIAAGAVDIAHLSATGTASASTFLRGDGTWGSPTGDMPASTYDPAGVSEQLVGLTATQTLTNKTIDASQLTGTVSVNRFNSGTGASSSTFLRGDGTWATPAGGGSGDVTKVGTPVDNQIGVWTGDGTLEGDTALTFNSTNDTLELHQGTAPHSSFISGAGIRARFATSSTDGHAAILTASATSAHRSIMVGARSRGTIDAPGAVVSGDPLFTFQAEGHDGTNRQIVAGIDFKCDGAVSAGVVPASVTFRTGSSLGTQSDRFTISSAGVLAHAGSSYWSTLELGHATDTTLARSAAGQVTIEGVQVLTASNTVTVTNKSIDAGQLTGTVSVNRFNSGTGASSSTFLRGDGTWAATSGDVTKVGTPVANRMAYWTGDGTLGHEAGFTYDPSTDTLAVTNLTVNGNSVTSLTDPNVDAIAFWDDSAGAMVYFTSLSGLTISGTTLSVDSASTTVAGRVELATTAEVNAGTDGTRAIVPDNLAASNFGAKEIAVTVFDTDTNVAVGDGKKMVPIPATLNGMNIVAVRACVYTQGVTGSTDVQIRRRRAGSNVDVLSTKVTIGAEYHAADGVINAANDDLATGDVLLVDVDAVHTTPPQGLTVAITCQLP